LTQAKRRFFNRLTVANGGPLMTSVSDAANIVGTPEQHFEKAAEAIRGRAEPSRKDRN
jgi:hypothetical protein